MHCPQGEERFWSGGRRVLCWLFSIVPPSMVVPSPVVGAGLTWSLGGRCRLLQVAQDSLRRRVRSLATPTAVSAPSPLLPSSIHSLPFPIPPIPAPSYPFFPLSSHSSVWVFICCWRSLAGGGSEADVGSQPCCSCPPHGASPSPLLLAVSGGS